MVALVVVAGLWPVGAWADQASDPGSPAARRLDLGLYDSCAILPAGDVRCWGDGAEGQLGYGNTENVGDDETPASVGQVNFGGGHTATAISAGDYHTCAILDDGSVRCWGYGQDGRLGYGSTDDVLDPSTAGAVNLGPGRTAKVIAAGGAHTCAILDDDSVRCWGYGFDGALGYGSPTANGGNGNRANVGDTPATTPDTAGPVDLGAGRTAVAISAGESDTCAILDDGSLLCWGYGTSGDLGYASGYELDTIGVFQTPGQQGPVDLGGRAAVAVATGDTHTCAILGDGGVECWGQAFSGELGYGNQTNTGNSPSTVPALLGSVPLGGHRAVAIAAGTSFTCAILVDGTVRCWGYGADGRLGYGSAENMGATPSTVPGVLPPVDLGPGRTAVAISAAGAHACATLDDGTIRCWGYGIAGELGYCNESNVGDTDTPASAGPVNLTPGDGGESCPPPVPASNSPPTISGRAVEGETLTEAHGSWSPVPTEYGYQWERCNGAGGGCGAIANANVQRYLLGSIDVGSTIRVIETASAGGGAGISQVSAPTAVVVKGVGGARSTGVAAQATRERGYRACLARVTARVKAARARTRLGAPSRRAAARRRLARELASGRARCARSFGRTPGKATGLSARPLPDGRIQLDFTAPGTDGAQPPAALSYLVKQSRTAIRTALDFSAASELCRGACRFAVTQVGAQIQLTVTGLKPHTTYYYAIAARDNVTGRPGPRSATVAVRTA